MQLAELLLATVVATTIGAASAAAQDTTHHPGPTAEVVAPGTPAPGGPPQGPVGAAWNPAWAWDRTPMMQPGPEGHQGMDLDRMDECMGMMGPDDAGRPDMAADSRRSCRGSVRGHQPSHAPRHDGGDWASPDTAFVQAMIAHHQGAIDMARVVVGFGSDPEIRKLAEGVITAQQGEIGVLRQWLARQPQP